MSDDNDDSTSKTEQSIEAQASQWVIRLRCGSGSDEDLEEHKAWLDANLMHRKAYVRLDALWDTLGEFAEKPEIIKARGKVKVIRPSAVVSLPERRGQQPAELQQSQQPSGCAPPTAPDGKKDSNSKKVWRPFVAAALMIGVVVVAGIAAQFSWNVSGQQAVYKTVIGEQKTIQLSDGSELLLDTETVLHADFSAQQRRIVLQQGRARFEVAHDKTRPFVVQAGSGRVTALGTAFVVRKDQQDVVVTLLEGKVAVTQRESNAETDLQSSAPSVVRELEVGQQLAYSDKGLSNADAVDIDRVMAWQQGLLIYENHLLTSVIRDLNRYSKRKILLGDKSMESIRITGVFKTGDNRKAIQALTTYFSMRVQTDNQGNLVLVPEAIEHAELGLH